MTDRDDSLSTQLVRAADRWQFDEEEALRRLHQTGRSQERRRARRAIRDMGVGLAVGVASVLIAVYVFLLRDNAQDGVGPSIQSTASNDGQPTGSFHYFVPRVAEGTNTGRTTMTATFVDGTAALFDYPSSIALQELGVQLKGDLVFDVPDGSRLRGTRTSIQFEPDDRAAPTAPGPVEPVQIPQEEGIGVRLGPWVVRVVDLIRTHGEEVTPELVAEFASKMQGRITEAGFLILEPELPVRIAGETDGTVLPALYFGGELVVVVGCPELLGDQVTVVNGVEVHRYIDGVEPGQDFLAWCDMSETMVFQFYDEELGEALASELRVSDVVSSG